MNKIAECLQQLSAAQVDIIGTKIYGVALTETEFRLMLILLADPEKMFSRKELIVAIWGKDSSITNVSLNVHIHRLRIKFGGTHDNRQQVIITRNRGGFQLSPRFTEWMEKRGIKSKVSLTKGESNATKNRNVVGQFAGII